MVRKLLERKLIEREGEEGFTLIELLVVVIIIGILAAIAIPVFLNQRESAYIAAAESDARNAAIQIETVFTAEGNYPDGQQWVGGGPTGVTMDGSAPAEDTTVGEVTVSDDVVLTFASDDGSGTYTIIATHELVEEHGVIAAYYDSAEGGLIQAPGDATAPTPPGDDGTP